MKLSYLLEKLDCEVVKGSTDIEVNNLVLDSRKAAEDDVFVCIKGAVFDSHKFIADVASKGAAAVIVEDESFANDVDITVVKTESTRKALAFMSAAYFGYPAEKLTTIGITGTKGKTTTTYMIKNVLDGIGVSTGLIGTIETIIPHKDGTPDEIIPSNNTTPESYTVQETFRKMVDAGVNAVVMEVSSQGLMLDRVAGFIFDYGVFTNLGQDHIGDNEHKDFEDYMNCKAKLFKCCKMGILNCDDAHFEDMLKGHTCEVETFGMSEKADFRASDIHLFRKPSILGIAYTLSGKMNNEIELDIPGEFNVYNSLSAIALCSHFTDDIEEIHNVLATVTVKGRTEIIKVKDEYTLMIDYAHNAMSLESLLSTLKQYEHNRLIALFGCGGNRARSRRFEMGETSSNMADLTIVTSDNPRTEDPEAIIDDIMVGVNKGPGKYVRITDRKEAIRYAINNGEEGDIIILAGKGHETYQEINGVKYDMDERVLIAEVMKEEGIL